MPRPSFTSSTFVPLAGQAVAADDAFSTRGREDIRPGSALNGSLAAWTGLPTGLNVTSLRIDLWVRLPMHSLVCNGINKKAEQDD